MARLELAVVTVSRNGIAATDTPVLAADGGQFVNDGRTFLRVNNTTAVSRTITFLTPYTVGSGPALAVADHAFVLPAAATERWLGPWPPGIYNQPDGKVYFDVSVDGISVRPFKVPAS